jgi:hypothetical protein
MSIKRRSSPIRRRAVSAAVVVTALAAAAPVGQASAALALPHVPALPSYHLPAVGALPAFTPSPLSFVGPSVGQVAVAMGPTVIGSVFNGGTTVCVSTVASNCSTNASP